MTPLTFTLLLSLSLQGFALTNNEISGLQMSPAALETGTVCQDCTKIFELLVDLFSNADLQKKMMEGIESLCAHLPGPTAKLCKEEVDKMLPVAITFFTRIAKPAEICKLIGLCSSCDRQEKMLSYFISEAFQAAAKSDNAKPSSQCTICVLIFKTLEELLPKERTEAVVIKLLEEVCHLVPVFIRHQCQEVIDKVGKTVLDAIIGQASPQTICSLLHMCKGEEALVVDPCTLPTYRCKDIRTALRCGTLYYCQKFSWKPLSYNTI